MKKRFRFLLLGAVSVLLALPLLAGCASPTAAQPDSPRQTASQEVQLEVPYLSQEDILPTGCEAVSAAMVLQYWGVDVTPEEVASMLPCAPLYQLRGQLYGPNPDEFFVGSPFEETGYGCYAPVIAGVLEEQLSRLSGRIHLSETAGRGQLRREIRALSKECAETDSKFITADNPAHVLLRPAAAEAAATRILVRQTELRASAAQTRVADRGERHWRLPHDPQSHCRRDKATSQRHRAS